MALMLALGGLVVVGLGIALYRVHQRRKQPELPPGFMPPSDASGNDICFSLRRGPQGLPRDKADSAPVNHTAKLLTRDPQPEVEQSDGLLNYQLYGSQ